MDNENDNGNRAVEMAHHDGHLNEERDEEGQQRYENDDGDDDEQQTPQTRRYLRLNQTPDDIESGGTIH